MTYTSILALGVDTGDRVTLIVIEDQVIMMNSAIYAMRMLQQGMAGEAERIGVQTEEDAVQLIKELRTSEIP